MALPIGMICRASRIRNGVREYAKDFGLKAFCFYPNKEKAENAENPSKTKTTPEKK